MTRIDCKIAAEYGLKPPEYVAQFVQRDGDYILLAMDEEENGFIRLNVESAEFVAHELLTIVEAIRKERQPCGTTTASSHG